MQYARSRPASGPILAIAIITLAAIVAALAVTGLSGTKTGFVLAIAAIGGPIMAYAAIVAPLVFPFGVYILAIPFDNILNVTAFGTLTKLLAILSGGAIILYLLRTRRTVKPSRSLLLWCALYAWAAMTAFWAIDSKAVFTELATSMQLLILYGAISMTPASHRTVRFVSLATITGAVIAALYGAYLFHSGVDIYYATGRLRITTDSGAIDPNHFAAALLLPIALCMTNMLHTRRWQALIVNFGAMSVMLVGVAISQSRGAFMAIAAIILYFFWRSRGRIRLFAVVGALAAGMVVFGSQTPLWQRFGEAISTGGAGRTSIWRVGLMAFKEHWFIGAGFNNFADAYDRVFLQTPHQIFGTAEWHRAPHNLLVGTSVELGIIGLILMLAAWGGQFRMLSNIPFNDEEYPMRVAVEAAIIGTFIAALFLDVMIFKYVWLTFMLAAIVRNAYYIRRPLYA